MRAGLIACPYFEVLAALFIAAIEFKEKKIFLNMRVSIAKMLS